MSFELPPFRDRHFRRKKKKSDDWVLVDGPKFSVPVADTHAHVQLLSDPALALMRAAGRGIGFIEVICDPVDDGWTVFENLGRWLDDAQSEMRASAPGSQVCGCPSCNSLAAVMPRTRIAVGVHPHNAKDYTESLERQMIERMHDPRVSCLGEIGLDYHYDYSPRNVQQGAFRRQIRLSKEAGLPISLHVREAHDDAFAILSEEGFPEAGAILHCFNLGPDELKRWVDAGCYIALGGPVTFKKAEEVREAAALVPEDRLLTETDAPYMTPEPLRGQTCEPAHTVFTLNRILEVRGFAEPGCDREDFAGQLFENALRILDRKPTAWQRGEAGR